MSSGELGLNDGDDADEPEEDGPATDPDAVSPNSDGESTPGQDDPVDMSDEPAQVQDGDRGEDESDDEAEAVDIEETDSEVDPVDQSDSEDAEDTAPPSDVQTYDRFTKVDGARYDRVNEFLRDRTHITAREWAIARLCADFRTETGVEMTKVGEHLPELVPFMTDTYTPQAVNQARASFEEKVRMAGATFLYGAMCDFFTADELDDVIYEATETAKFLLEVEGVDLAVEAELGAEDRISDVMREVRAASEALRNGPVECPDCGHQFGEETLE